MNPFCCRIIFYQTDHLPPEIMAPRKRAKLVRKPRHLARRSDSSSSNGGGQASGAQQPPPSAQQPPVVDANYNDSASGISPNFEDDAP